MLRLPAPATGTTKPPRTQPGRECRHNLNYWRFGGYLGIGAGAHSKLSFPTASSAVRQQPKRYRNRSRPALRCWKMPSVGPTSEFEFMLNALRLTDGVPAALFAERTGYPLAQVARELAEAEARGLIEHDATTIRPTELGRRFLNDLQALFLPASGGARAAPLVRQEPVRDGH
jgi:oxygen-independent coproporphyrinogen-3 oxidase